MKIFTTTLISLCLLGSPVSFAERNSFKTIMESSPTALESWTAGDHLGAAKRYEEEARLLQAEARGMETVETKILPFLQVEAINEAGVQKLIDRRLKEAEENMKLASWHHKEGLQLLAKKEASLSGASPSHKAVTTGVSHSKSSPVKPSSYELYDWMADELEHGG